MKTALLLCGLFPWGCIADSVYVSTAPAGNVPAYPSQYALKATPMDTDVVSVCDSASIPVGRGDMANCASARRWLPKTQVQASAKVGYCYGASMTVLACDIANGGGEGWQLASAIWTSPPIPPGPPVFTGSASLSCTPPTQNTDGSPLMDLIGYHWLYGAANPPVMPLATTTACSYVANNLTVGTWFFAVTAYTPSAESALSAVVSKAITQDACTVPRPANKTQSVACPVGTVGSWTQTATYVAATYPLCWTQGPWLPAAAPAGSCVSTSPPTLKSSENVGYRLYSANANKDTYQRAGTIPAPVPCTAAVFTDLAGVTRNIIADRNRLVVDSGVSRPMQVFAKCALQ